MKLVTYIFLTVSLLLSFAADAHKIKTAFSIILFNERTNNLEVVHRFYLHDAEEAVWELFDNPQSSSAAFVIALVLLVLTMVSCLAFCLQTISFFYAGDQTVWEVIEAICIIVFTIEYVLRLWTSNVLPGHTVKAFVKQPMNVCDALAVSPLYIEIIFAGSGAAFLRVLRAIRPLLGSFV